MGEERRWNTIAERFYDCDRLPMRHDGLTAPLRKCEVLSIIESRIVMKHQKYYTAKCGINT